MPIRVLPPQVAARIAAGEVVERPASIVKELVENSLDSGATRISVEAVSGGIASIRVVDDGSGIEREELARAFERHATSKLDDGDDLSRILTLGFRGEALPSIAAAAVVEAVSRPPGSDSASVITLGPEMEPSLEYRGAPVGTSITVRELFAQQPARRKFLRSPASEAGAIASVVTAYALAYAEIRFSLLLDGRKTLATTGSGELRDVVAAVYGAEVASAMLEVMPAEGEVKVMGVAAAPHVSRAGRGYVTLFVNRRWIQSRRLVFAVEQAYEGMLMVGRRPIVVLNLRVPYEEVDVNVHPAKAEVRFRDESAVFSAVQRAVRQALLSSSPVPAVRVEAQTLTLQAQAAPPLLWQHGVSAEQRRSATATLPEIEISGATPAQTLPVLRVIGQFGAVYIVAEGPEGMYLIDQHAAHERVLYDEFVERRASRSPEMQALLEPLAVELAPGQRLLLTKEDLSLRGHGLDAEPFGGDGAYLLRAVPRSLSVGDIRGAVFRLLDLMAEEAEVEGRDRVAMSLACHGAVRAGKTLSLEEMRELVRRLEETASPNTCPHGRPTMVHMSAELLAREFGRR